MGLFGGPKGLPAPVYAELIVKHGLTHEYAERLRCLEEKTVIDGKKSKLFKVFNPDAIPKSINFREYKDLDTHPELVLFEGYLLEDNTLSLKSRKPP